MTDPIVAMRDPDMSEATAVALYENEWWKSYPARDVALAQLKQDRLCMPFDDFKDVVTQAIGGPVWTHEFLNMKALVDRIESDQRGGIDPIRSLEDVLLRRTRSGMWVTRGRRYRSKALAMRSLNVIGRGATGSTASLHHSGPRCSTGPRRCGSASAGAWPRRR